VLITEAPGDLVYASRLSVYGRHGTMGQTDRCIGFDDEKTARWCDFKGILTPV
jgi:hypothetical protein